MLWLLRARPGTSTLQVVCAFSASITFLPKMLTFVGLPRMYMSGRSFLPLSTLRDCAHRGRGSLLWRAKATSPMIRRVPILHSFVGLVVLGLVPLALFPVVTFGTLELPPGFPSRGEGGGRQISFAPREKCVSLCLSLAFDILTICDMCSFFGNHLQICYSDFHLPLFENPFTKRITADKRAPSANPFFVFGPRVQRAFSNLGLCENFSLRYFTACLDCSWNLALTL